jgi:hypothetical protein
MLVTPARGGGAVVLMHNPQNELEFIETSDTQKAMATGYVPVRAAELGEFMSTMKDEVARLTSENARLQSDTANQAPLPIVADVLAQTRANQAAEKAAKRQQMIQTWLMLQNMNRPQTLNLNVTDCTRSPAMCAGR